MPRRRKHRHLDRRHVSVILAALGVLLAIAYKYDKAARKKMQKAWTYVTAPFYQTNIVGYIWQFLEGGKALIDNAVRRLYEEQLPDLAEYMRTLWKALTGYVHRLLSAGVTKYFPHVFASGTVTDKMDEHRAEQIRKGLRYLDDSVHMSDLQRLSTMDVAQRAREA